MTCRIYFLSKKTQRIDQFVPKQSQNPLILCAVDGNVNIFNPSYLTQGLQGGKKAAQALTKTIAEYLSQEEVQVFGRLSFWITVYLSREALLADLVGGNICTAEQFTAFLFGFSQASPRFVVIDVGLASEDIELKIRGTVVRRDSFARIADHGVFTDRIPSDLCEVPPDSSRVPRRYECPEAFVFLLPR